MSSYSQFDVVIGEGSRERNIGAIIDKYNGGITRIDRGIGSGWNNNYSTGLDRYGSTWAYGNLSMKEITIEFTIYGSIPQFTKFREEMAIALDTPNGPEKLTFNDEPNWYYMAVTSGTINLSEEIGSQSATGTIKFDVPDGLKHSTYSKVLNSKTNNEDIGTYLKTPQGSVVINVNNQGGVKAYPKFKIKQTSDNGYIGIVSPTAVMALGVQDATLEGEKVDSGGYKSQILIDIKRGDSSAETGWGLFTDASSRYYESPIAGTICVNGGKMVFRKIDGYPNVGGLAWNLSGTSVDGYRWQGGCSSYILKEDENGEIGALNWRCDFNLKVWESRIGQTGFYTIAMVDENKKIIAAYDISKDDTNSDNTKVRFWTEKSTWKKEIIFGANNNEPGQRNPNPAFNSHTGSAYFMKDGQNITFSYNGTPYTWSVPTAESKICREIVILSGRYQNENIAKTGGFFHTLLCESLRFTKNNVRRYDLVPNRYPKNSLLTVDCYQGEIYLSPTGDNQGELSQGQRIIGSDFISLDPGETTLEITTSTWCKTPPEVEIEWTENTL